MAKARAVRLPEDLDAWVEEYVRERGVSSSEFLQAAVSTFREDCEAGVPEIRELVKRARGEREPKPGECLCPVFEDGARGFRQACPVHGFGDMPVAERRAHFNRATAARAELFSQLKAPESSRRWGRNPEKS